MDAELGPIIEVCMTISISKSKFLSGRQCPKLLWTQYNNKAVIPPADAGQEFIFATGHVVGDRAKALYPDGIEIDCSGPGGRPDIPATVAETALPLRKPLFEASFLADGRYVRVDILVPAADEAWDLIEVKSSTKVKDINLWDVAYQHDCLTRAGVKLDRLYLMHLDNTYVRQGAIDPEALFHAQDVTAEALSFAPQVPPLFDQFSQVIAGGDPQTPIGPHCRDPYTCAMVPLCWAGLPENHVTEMYYGGKKAFSWMTSGWTTIDQVPADQLSPRQLVQQRAVKNGAAHFDAPAVRRWLDRLTHPLWHLDFETMNPAVPLFQGTRPYQRISFQFSLHVQDSPGAEPRHIEYLATDDVDPRPGLLEGLKAIGPAGTVLAFNMGFENGVLAELGRDFPPYQAMTGDLADRLMDLADPFRNFDAYHPDQRGRYSLKNVLPAWTDLGYQGMEIADGQAASRGFFEAVFGSGTADKDGTLSALKEYCALDTLAMVELLGVLREKAQ